VLLLALLLSGCASRSFVLRDPAYRVERSATWVVVVESPRASDLAAPTKTVGRLVANELSLRWFNVLDRDLLLQADPQLEPRLSRAAQQASLGQRVEPEVVERLSRDHGVGQLLVVDVFRYDQFWGRETRITRVGVEARLVQLQDNRILWQGRADPDVAGLPGGGFEAAAHRAAGELVRLMSGELPRVEDTPLATWPLLEHLVPN
jgi:hypothetical protein